MAVSGMADTSGSHGFVDKTLTKGYRTSTVLAQEANYGTINNLDTALSTINGTYYTVARLQRMHKNDKIYALRMLSGDSGTI